MDGRSDTSTSPLDAALNAVPHDVPTLVALCDHLICAVRPLNPLSAYCFVLGRDALITWEKSGGDRCLPSSQ